MSYLDELFSLHGKTAIVTGGGRGIGQVVALGLSKAKADIVILSRSDASETVKLINDRGEEHVYEIQQELKKYEQPHISKSLDRLKSIGLIKYRKEGLNVYYSLKICCIKEFLNCLNKILDNKEIE